jgi:hypothetical protein
VTLGELAPDVQQRIAQLPGEWLEFDPQSGAVVIAHVQPSTGPILPTVTVELVRILSEIPHEQQTAIEGGDLFVHTEEPATQLVRLRVERGGALNIQWAHPEYAGAEKRPFTDQYRIEVEPWEQRLDGRVTFECDDPVSVAESLQTLADTYEGLYPEGDFQAAADEASSRVTVEMSDVNLDGCLLIGRLQEVARGGTMEGSFDLGSFTDFVPEHLLRFVIEEGEIWVQHPLLWS